MAVEDLHCAGRQWNDVMPDGISTACPELKSGKNLL